jgi:hypothetical protein
MRINRLLAVAAVAALTALVAAPAAAISENGAGGVATYEITITNLTGGQPFTPPLVATHRGAADLFEVGEPANEAIQQIAENGNLGPAIAVAEGDRQITDFGVFLSDPPPVLPGGSVTFDIESVPGARQLTWVSMLICTNDGFTGLDSVDLPKKVGDSATLYTDGYDAGTEVNTEDFADIVPPCQGLTGVSSDDAGTGMSNPALAEDGVITHHPGVLGGNDLLTDVHGWSGPVAMVTITRTG